ncbi:helix-turn-helix domain-containing protein [Pantoea agglomerans]|uniref:helix-turn-helix domain-containing protein n=1 Tax=Enterobacter agglomerans TaxID=549 RepID=UPI00301BBE16
MTINIKDTRYFWMKSHAVINGVAMTAADKVVYETLHAFASTTGVVSPSVAYISANTALGSATVTRSLKRLEEAKLLIKTKHGNRANSYELDLAELSKLGVGYAERMQQAQEEAAAGKAERMAKIGKSFVVVRAIRYGKECVDRVIEILRSMGTPMNKQMFPSETPQEAPRASRLMVPRATKVIDSAPVTKAPEKREAWEDEWQDVMATEAGPQYDPEGW